MNTSQRAEEGTARAGLYAWSADLEHSRDVSYREREGRVKGFASRDPF